MGPDLPSGISWVEAASLDDLAPGSAREFVHDGRAYAVFRVGDRISCIDGLCPHRGGHLASGPLGRSVVTCPRRGCLRWRFDVLDGSSPIGEGVRRRLHPVRVEGRTILVALAAP